MNSADIKEAARFYGADLVGIAPIERFDGLPEQNHPRTFAPGTRSVIAVAHRIMRGTMRGIEEGTSFSNTYGCFGHSWAESQFLVKTLMDLCSAIENEGFEASPVMSKCYSGNAFVPDYKFYAHAAGLGSTGKGGFFLTPQYGHRQRFGFIFTTLELEGDDVIECNFCGNCNACIAACPLNAMAENAPIDWELCKQCRNGATATPEGADPVDRYASSCGRACMVALEEKVGNTFAAKFRKRSVWQRGLDGKSVSSGNQFAGGKCPDKFEGR